MYWVLEGLCLGVKVRGVLLPHQRRTMQKKHDQSDSWDARGSGHILRSRKVALMTATRT